MILLIEKIVNKREIHCMHKLCDTCTCVNLRTLKPVVTVSNFLGYLR